MTTLHALVESTSSKQALISEAEKLAQSLEYDFFVIAYGHSNDHAPELLLGNTPSAWREQFKSFGPDYYESLKRDPVCINLAGNTSTPVIWDRQSYRESEADIIWEAAAEFGMCSGVDLPVMSPHGDIIVTSLMRRDPLPTVRRLGSVIDELRIFGACLAAMAVPLFEAQIFAETLTVKEIDLLDRVLAGHSAEKIASDRRWSVASVQRQLNKLAKRAKTQDVMGAAAMMARAFSRQS